MKGNITLTYKAGYISATLFFFCVGEDIIRLEGKKMHGLG